MTDDFQPFRRSQIAELRPYVAGEALPDRVSISASDKEAGSPKPGDMIARNPANHEDQWLVAADYFAANFEPAFPSPVEPAPEIQLARNPGQLKSEPAPLPDEVGDFIQTLHVLSNPIAGKAAALIRTLSERVVGLEKERDEWKQCTEVEAAEHRRAHERIVRLEADDRETVAMINDLDAQLAALRSGGEGWKLVPVKPSVEMIEAFAGTHPASMDADDEAGWHDAYASMLAAAPPPPSEGDGWEGNSSARAKSFGLDAGNAIRDIATERRRQIDERGYTAEFDECYDNGDLIAAAVVYADFSRDFAQARRFADPGHAPVGWPWLAKYFRPTSPRRMLVKAGALIAAEIDRMDRAAPPTLCAPAEKNSGAEPSFPSFEAAKLAGII